MFHGTSYPRELGKEFVSSSLIDRLITHLIILKLLTKDWTENCTLYNAEKENAD